MTTRDAASSSSSSVSSESSDLTVEERRAYGQIRIGCACAACNAIRELGKSLTTARTQASTLRAQLQELIDSSGKRVTCEDLEDILARVDVK